VNAVSTSGAPSGDRPAKMGHVTAGVLGPFTVQLNGVSLDAARWRQGPQRLLQLLLTSPDHRRGREEAIDLLWPESTATAGASNLRHAMHLLRHTVDGRPPLVVSEGPLIRLNPAYSWRIDLDELERARTVEDIALLEELFSVHAGEALLERRYDEWAEPVRQRAARLRRELGFRLAECFRTQERYADAASCYERLLEDDWADEEAMRALLAVMEDQGRRGDALRRFTAFEQLLAAELDTEPDMQTLAIIERLRTRSPAAPEHLPASVPLSYPLPLQGLCLGREDEIEMLVRMVFVDGGPSLALLAAEAGLGKTSVLGTVARRVLERGVLVLAGGCYEQEGRLPYGPFHDALADFVRSVPPPLLRDLFSGLAPELIRIVPELGEYAPVAQDSLTPDGDDARLRLFSAVARALERIGEQRRLVLLLDDLHWADDTTVQLMHFLARRPPRRVTIVGAFRREDLAEASALTAIVPGAHTSVCVVDLPPLSEGVLDGLVRARLGGPVDAPTLHRIHVRSGGNPLFALQMIRLLEEQGELQRAESGWQVTPGAEPGLPAALRDTIARRLRRLGVRERAVLARGAVLGQQFAYEALALLWDGDEEELLDALDACTAGQLIEDTETGYAFRHPLLHAGVYDQIPTHRRRALHARAASIVETLWGAGVEEHGAELARHWLAAGSAYQRQAVRYLVAAGATAEKAVAYAEAERYYRQALDALAPPAAPAERAPILRRLGSVLRVQGSMRAAIATLEEALAIVRACGDRPGEAAIVADLCSPLLLTGEPETAMERVRALLPTLPTPSLERGRLLLNLSTLYRLTGKLAEGISTLDAALADARAIADHNFEVEVLHRQAYAYMSMGRWSEARQQFDGLLAGRIPENNPSLRNAVLKNAGVISWLQGDLPASRQYLEEALALARALGDDAESAFDLALLGQTLFYLGDWPTARDTLQTAHAMSSGVEEVFRTAYIYSFLGALRVAEGRWDEAKTLLEHAVEMAARWGSTEAGPHATGLLAELDLAVGQPECALRRLQSLLEQDDTGVVFTFPVAIEAFTLLGDDDAAERTVARALARTRDGQRLPLPDVLRAVAGRRLRQGRDEHAWRAIAEGLVAARDMSCPYAEARLLRLSGMAKIERGLPGGEEEIDRARAIFDRLGAVER
jgi:DNA-binding SARP family transcriptional activator